MLENSKTNGDVVQCASFPRSLSRRKSNGCLTQCGLHSRSRSRSRSQASSGASTCDTSSSPSHEVVATKSSQPCLPIASSKVIRFGPKGYDFAAPEPMPLVAQHRVHELLESGRLFRYQGEVDDVADLERDFSKYIGLPYTMACNSGGCGIFLALKAVGVQPGDKVLLNSWTLAPVPGAIVHAHAVPIFVDTHRETLAIDIADLEAKAMQSGATVLLLSYMRGQIPDMDAVIDIKERLGLTIIEDCAHTLGAKWKCTGEDVHRHLGTFGDVGVWSLQTNKSLNSGEGGLISTVRQDIAGFITIATGSYGHFAMNGASGNPDHLNQIYTEVPNMSMRMTTIAAALARPQLELLPGKLDAWARHASIIRNTLAKCAHIRTVKKESCMVGTEIVVWSSIQFELLGFDASMVEQTIEALAALGIPLAWFGGPCKGFTSTLKDWKFADPNGDQWKESYADTVKSLVDLPLYHTATWSDVVFSRLAETITETVARIANAHQEDVSHIYKSS